MSTRWILTCAAALSLICVTSQAEPYIAIDKGLQCSACHSHAAGGGKRSTYGTLYARTEMPSRIAASDTEFWNGKISQWLSVGGDLRGGFEYSSSDDTEDRSAFDVTRGNLYVEASLLNNRLSVYFDQQIAPNSSINREAYVMLMGEKFRFAAGQFYLPYGWRLQDDTAFIRRATGINRTNPDRGVQLGYETGRWSHVMSVTNGSGGGSETDKGKQVSYMTVFVSGRWRVGVSANHNDSDAGDRTMGNLFGGLKTGPIAWLFEIDAIRDKLSSGSDLDGLAGLIEGNWRFRRGHNVKVSYEYLDPDRDTREDHQIRWSALYEWTPMAFVQLRLGARFNDSPPEISGTDRETVFAELHGFF